MALENNPIPSSERPIQISVNIDILPQLDILPTEDPIHNLVNRYRQENQKRKDTQQETINILTLYRLYLSLTNDRIITPEILLSERENIETFRGYEEGNNPCPPIIKTSRVVIPLEADQKPEYLASYEKYKNGDGDEPEPISLEIGLRDTLRINALSYLNQLFNDPASIDFETGSTVLDEYNYALEIFRELDLIDLETENEIDTKIFNELSRQSRFSELEDFLVTMRDRKIEWLRDTRVNPTIIVNRLRNDLGEERSIHIIANYITSTFYSTESKGDLKAQSSRIFALRESGVISEELIDGTINQAVSSKIIDYISNPINHADDINNLEQLASPPDEIGFSDLLIDQSILANDIKTTIKDLLEQGKLIIISPEGVMVLGGIYKALAILDDTDGIIEIAKDVEQRISGVIPPDDSNPSPFDDILPSAKINTLSRKLHTLLSPEGLLELNSLYRDNQSIIGIIERRIRVAIQEANIIDPANLKQHYTNRVKEAMNAN